MNKEPTINKAESLEKAEAELSDEELQAVNGGTLKAVTTVPPIALPNIGGIKLPVISIISNKEWQE